VAIHGRPPTQYAHLLSLLVLLPFLGAAAALALGDRSARLGATTALSGTLAIALVAAGRFVPGLGRADGNDGFQLVERAVLVRPLGVEWYLGVDGASLPLVVSVLAVGLAACALSGAVTQAPARFLAAAQIAVGGAVLALVGVDLALVAGGFALALVCSALAVTVAGAPSSGRRVMFVAVAASVALALAVVLISSRGGSSMLVDGSSSPRALALTSLMRVSLVKGAPMLGLPFPALALLLVLVASVLVLPVTPLSSWLADVLDEAPPSVAMIPLALGPALGAYVLVRIGSFALPEAMAWAATGLAAFGAMSALVAGLGALAATRASQLVARLAAVHGGVVLLGAASLTATGLLGVLASAVAFTLALPLAGYLVASACARARTFELAELGGIGRGAPLGGGALAIALAALAGAPGFGGFWGAVLSVQGVIPSQRLAAVGAALALALAAGACGRSLLRAVVSPVPDRLAKSVALEAFGGRFPELTRAERVAVVPLALLLLALGFAPRLVFSVGERTALDMAAFVNPPGPGQIVRADAPAATLALLERLSGNRTRPAFVGWRKGCVS
jgi:NADH:ubiquinone oxidoreductase subunit 4 (subunit M)